MNQFTSILLKSSKKLRFSNDFRGKEVIKFAWTCLTLGPKFAEDSEPHSANQN